MRRFVVVLLCIDPPPERASLERPRGPRRRRATPRPRPPRRPAGSPPRSACALTIEREAVTRPAAGCGSKAAARSSTRPPWAPTPGSRKTARGISSRRRPSSSGWVAPVTAPTSDRPQSPVSSAPSSSASRASRSCSGGSPSSWSSAAPGLEVRTSTKQPAPAAAAASISGSSESRPSSGLAVKASAPRPATGPNGPSVSPHQRLRVRACGDRHVAALAVGEHEQAVVARDRDGALERLPARARRGARSRRAGA